MNATTSTEGVISIEATLSSISRHFRPLRVVKANGQELKAVKVLGEFPWHCHDDADEVFVVWRGEVEVQTREGKHSLAPGDAFVVPQGMEHRVVAQKEAHVLLFEPLGLRNTGSIFDPDFTADEYSAGVP